MHESSIATSTRESIHQEQQLPEEGRQRVIISGVKPEIDHGRFPAKRTVGDDIRIEADAFVDGHDALRAVALMRSDPGQPWTEVPMAPLVNDRWRGSFPAEKQGWIEFTVKAWVDPFLTWLRDMHKRIEANRVERTDLLIGAELIEKTVPDAPDEEGQLLAKFAQKLRKSQFATVTKMLTTDEQLPQLMERLGPRRYVTTYDRVLRIWVDRERARFSSWYEMFPRSAGPEGRHGTFKDCIERLPYIQAMGFDVLYLPPIHPIGQTNRKGKNNALRAEPDDVGSPWAIGGEVGGHKAIHPDLGTLEDFHALVSQAREAGIEIALDIAYQCSPDHPYVKEHPEWFRSRPDGTIQYAENPPKKYEDIYPFDFETEAWRELWIELRSVLLYWIEQGVRIFRVDNPHTKAFPFWEWAIRTVQDQHPDTIFLAEAFTRPKVMLRLAKLGFTQSYTYFAWRNSRYELMQYMDDLLKEDVHDCMRPNFWPNTPDILTEHLQTGGRSNFAARLILAGTLTANYGIYGPAFELCEAQAREFGSEEYLDSEKYQIRQWDLKSRHTLRPLITRVNRIRRENPALQRNDTLVFHPTDNEYILCYSKTHPDPDNVIICMVNLDPHHTHSAWVDLRLDELGLPYDQPYQVHDLVSDARYFWSGGRNFIQLDPHAVPGHILRVRRKVHTEHDFDYYL